MAWGKRLAAATIVLLVSSVAVAQPAGNSSFVPVSLPTAPAEGGSVVVEPGDHLWKISQDRVDQMLGRRAAPDEVAPYWLTVITANRDRLRSGDPDLIYPGEVVTLPAAG